VSQGPLPRVLIIGASGQVGRALCAVFESGYDVVAASHRHVEGHDEHVDLADGPGVRQLMHRLRPEIVLLAGGMCNVDGCEIETELCDQVNVVGTQVLAEEAWAVGARVVFFSTDHVFDGSRDRNREIDPVAPVNVYSSSKVKAEHILRRVMPGRHLILRTSSVYGVDTHHRNFVVRLVDRVSQRRSLEVPEDQWGSPTFTEDLARTARLLIERGEKGTFHATGPDYVSRLAFALQICEEFGLDTAMIVPRPTSSLRQPAPRPRGVLLDCDKLNKVGLPPFVGIESGLTRLRESMTTSVDAR
jgi:dTDP-4-dehydrorhamnose reductase